MARRKSGSSKKRRRGFLIRGGRLQYPDVILLLLLVSLVSVQLTKWVLDAGGAQSPGNPQIERTSADSSDRTRFIKALVPVAQQEEREHHVLASITLAQAALESDWGRSELSSKYNNLFGMKSSAQNSVQLTTSEYVNGQWITVKARFAVYGSWDESVRAHTQLFLNGTQWDRNHYQAVLQSTDYHQAARALQDKGYATDPGYAQKLVSLIEEYKLDLYD